MISDTLVNRETASVNICFNFRIYLRRQIITVDMWIFRTITAQRGVHLIDPDP